MQPVQSRSYASTLAHSPIAAIAATCVAASFFAIARACGKIAPKTFYASLGGSALLSLGIVCVMWKRLKFEITLEWTKLNSKDWYNEIPLPGNHDEDVKLYLGALPIEGKPQTEISTNYISLIEQDELMPTPFSHPITIKKNFRRIIETPDFEPVSTDNLREAIDAIRYCLTKMQVPTYVHCKAGRGRSAMAVIGYFMKHHGMSYDDAFSYVNKHRPQINMNTAQEARMREFGDILKKGTQASC